MACEGFAQGFLHDLADSTLEGDPPGHGVQESSKGSSRGFPEQASDSRAPNLADSTLEGNLGSPHEAGKSGSCRFPEQASGSRTIARRPRWKSNILSSIGVHVRPPLETENCSREHAARHCKGSRQQVATKQCTKGAKVKEQGKTIRDKVQVDTRAKRKDCNIAGEEHQRGNKLGLARAQAKRSGKENLCVKKTGGTHVSDQKHKKHCGNAAPCVKKELELNVSGRADEDDVEEKCATEPSPHSANRVQGAFAWEKAWSREQEIIKFKKKEPYRCWRRFVPTSQRLPGNAYTFKVLDDEEQIVPGTPRVKASKQQWEMDCDLWKRQVERYVELELFKESGHYVWLRNSRCEVASIPQAPHLERLRDKSSSEWESEVEAWKRRVKLEVAMRSQGEALSLLRSEGMAVPSSACLESTAIQGSYPMEEAEDLSSLHPEGMVVSSSSGLLRS
eukprot:TRINITY_DN236_c0_g1_i1.p1 TRINITY_DN236_c0_g1~~TRINITY_DN236_c0_g1_i1.p1  ORF type:complete len:448 (+),score=63.58 TRINITY_DN236_c0_g1_i1:51-1394(+)